MVLVKQHLWHLLGAFAADQCLSEASTGDMGYVCHTPCGTRCVWGTVLQRLWSVMDIAASSPTEMSPLHAIVWQTLVSLNLRDRSNTLDSHFEVAAVRFWANAYRLCAPFRFSLRMRTLLHCFHGVGHAAWSLGASARTGWEPKLCEPYRTGSLHFSKSVHDYAVGPDVRCSVLPNPAVLSGGYVCSC